MLVIYTLKIQTYSTMHTVKGGLNLNFILKQFCYKKTSVKKSKQKNNKLNGLSSVISFFKLLADLCFRDSQGNCEES